MSGLSAEQYVSTYNAGQKEVGRDASAEVHQDVHNYLNVYVNVLILQLQRLKVFPVVRKLHHYERETLPLW